MDEKSYNIQPFWLEDITVLINSDSFTKILPQSTMSRSEQLNTITRFCLYYIILLVITGKHENWIQIPIMIIVMAVIIYFIFARDEEGKQRDLYRLKQNREGMGNVSSEDTDEDDDNIEIGYYGEDNKVKFHKKRSKTERALNKLRYSLDEITEYNRATCRRPTKDNPFMNPTLADIGKDDVPVACNADDEDIKNEIKETFNEDLYRDVEDLFDVKNSQRQFYTVPTSMPRDTMKFANWLYKTPSTCKSDQQRCLKHEDLRFAR